MEEVVVLLIQFVVEVLFEALIYVPFDVILARDSEGKAQAGCGWVFCCAVAGGVLGRLSLLVVPHLIYRSETTRLANLALGPAIAAGLAWLLAVHRRSRGQSVSPGLHLGTAYLFVLAFAGVRLAYATA